AVRRLAREGRRETGRQAELEVRAVGAFADLHGGRRAGERDPRSCARTDAAQLADRLRVVMPLARFDGPALVRVSTRREIQGRAADRETRGIASVDPRAELEGEGPAF